MPNPKCQKCGKTVYPMEAECSQGLTWHKGCFRCQGIDDATGEVCNVKLTLKTANGVGGKIYCNKHVPRDKPTATTVEGSMALSGAKDAQKMGSSVNAVNNEKRGDGAETYIGAGVDGDLKLMNAKRSQQMGSSVNAVNNEKRGDGAEKYIGATVEGDLKLSNAKRSQQMGSEVNAVNEQVRKGAGERNAQVADMATSTALSAPKTGTVNEQVRGEMAGQRNAQVADMATATALSAPKTGTVNEQVRGEMAGQRNAQVADMATATALSAPKTGTVNEQVRLATEGGT